MSATASPAPADLSEDASSTAASSVKDHNLGPERKYKCQFCNRAFSRSEHRSRHERSRMCPVIFQLNLVYLD